MEQKQIVQAITPAHDILEEAKSHCKPRISLLQMAESKVDKVNRPEQSKPVTEPDIDSNAKKLVMLTISSPFLSTSGYYNLLGLNYRYGNEAKGNAIKGKLLIEHEFHSGKKGGKTVLLEPTKTAFDIFKLPPEYVNCGFVHRYLQFKVKEGMIAKGIKATIEKTVNGKAIDLVVEGDNTMTAVEIAVTDRHEVVNLRKDIFQAGFTNVVIVCKDKDVLSAVKKKLSSAFDSDILSKVKCCLLAEFLEENG